MAKFDEIYRSDSQVNSRNSNTNEFNGIDLAKLLSYTATSGFLVEIQEALVPSTLLKTSQKFQ